jgi:hypothetical protein
MRECMMATSLPKEMNYHFELSFCRFKWDAGRPAINAGVYFYKIRRSSNRCCPCHLDDLGLEIVFNDKDTRQGFAHGHIPAAHLLKGFYNVERKQISTMYVSE